jgi:hypothetical protein
MRKINVHNQQVLLQLYGMLHCSLARYLASARPWSRRSYSLLMAVSRKLASEHQHFADEIARNLESRRQMTSSSIFPVEFTYYNDVAVEHLAPVLLQHQRHLIGAATTALGLLGLDREMRQVLTKLVASLRKYADILEELLMRSSEKQSHDSLPSKALKLPNATHLESMNSAPVVPHYAA